MRGGGAWAIIDRIAHKYTGQPYPLRTDRVVFLVEPERAQRSRSHDRASQAWALAGR
jgi:hypothetical protein